MLRGVVLVVAVVVASGCSGGTTGHSSSARPSDNAKIAAQARGGHGAYTIIVRATDRKSGVPIGAADVTVYGEMTSPHPMLLMGRPLHEVSAGTYRGSYQFIMPGTWDANIVLKTKNGDLSTSALRIQVGR